ncbi:MAG: class I SAM-dependent methyltransferase [Clostridiaceae bacterium]
MNSKNYFNDVANQWDSMRQDFFSEDVREKAYKIANVKKGALAADIGSGTGFLSEGLLQKDVNVIAIDFSEEMIKQLQCKYGKNKAFHCRQGQDDSLPIDDNSVDYSMANMYLHHVENPLKAIKEMTRILKTGGKLVISDLDEHNFEFLKTEQFDRWMGFNRSDIKQWFLEAGLKNVTIDCVGSNCCTTSNTCGENASISIFIAYGEK